MTGSRRWMYARRNSDGFYNEQHIKGASMGSSNATETTNTNEFANMVEDVFGIHKNDIDEDLNITAQEYYLILDKANKPLWDGCTTTRR
ncbi:hypothetical protein LIER_41142 [Lithospermum erythrorhizon]|uniref:Uncharacterized protein n=1 Tax=Lithospermum erythrorhizon TaxID=34254 RepID=A0AAV3R4M6_LITER